MNGKDLNKQIDAFKRASSDLVREMHARKLAIPAGALLLAILAAIVLLPSGSTPPPAPPTAANPSATSPVVRVAQVSMIEPSTLDDDIPLSSSGDPFIGTSGYSCTRVGSGEPRTYDCEVSDLKVRIICTSSSAGGAPCAEPASSGATGGGSASSGGASSGATQTTGGSGDTGTTTPDNSGTGDSTPTKTTYYTVSVSIDGSTKKNVIAGDQLPDAKSPLATYAGTNDAHTKAVFLAADGVTVTGVPMDATFGSFSMKKGQSVTLTDAGGVQHKMTLKSISKVTK